MFSIDEILKLKEKGGIKDLILNIQNDNEDIRAFIAQTLGDMGSNESIEPLIILLGDNSPKVRKEAAMSLGLISDSSSVKPLINALKDKNEEVRQISAFSLIKIGDKRSIEPLTNALNDSSQNVREIASLGISIFNKSDLNLENQLVDYTEKLQLYIKPESFLRTPKVIVDIISKIALFYNPKTVLDPACGSGSLILELEKILTNSTISAVGMNKEFFRKPNGYENIKLNFEDFFQFKNENKIKFDLIVSDMFIHNINIENIAKQDIKFKIAILLESLELLSKKGRLIFLVPEYFLYSGKHQKARNFIIEKYSLEGVISIPSNISYLYSGVKASLLIIKKSKIEESFFAEYKNESSLEPIISNFIKHKTNKNPTQGFFIDFSILKKKDTTWTFKYFKEFSKPKNLKKSEYHNQLFSEITKVKSKYQHNSLAFPKDPFKNDNFKFKLSNDINKNEEDQYSYYILKNQTISPKFLKLFLNSEKVQDQIKKILTNQNDVDKLDSIQIPLINKEIQIEILDANKKSKYLRNKIDLLEKRFNESLFQYSEIIELTDFLMQNNMIWPIVSSYIAINSSSNLDEIIIKYFNYFEFILAFNSIVLISSIPDDLFFNKKDFIFAEKFSRPTFGNWLNLNRRLRDVYNKMIKNKSFVKSLQFDIAFYKKLIDKSFLNDINHSIELRNEYVHRGGNKLPINEKKELVKNLKKLSKRSFKFLEAYMLLELIYTLKLDKNNGLYTIGIKKLKGYSYPFYETNIETEEDMDTKALYLYDPNSDQRIKLKDELIRLEECNKCGRISLYIFNKLSINELSTLNTYISYQDEIHPFYNTDTKLKDLIF